jgi:hypothetical protein
MRNKIFIVILTLRFWSPWHRDAMALKMADGPLAPITVSVSWFFSFSRIRPEAVWCGDAGAATPWKVLKSSIDIFKNSESFIFWGTHRMMRVRRSGSYATMKLVITASY